MPPAKKNKKSVKKVRRRPASGTGARAARRRRLGLRGGADYEFCGEVRNVELLAHLREGKDFAVRGRVVAPIARLSQHEREDLALAVQAVRKSHTQPVLLVVSPEGEIAIRPHGDSCPQYDSTFVDELTPAEFQEYVEEREAHHKRLRKEMHRAVAEELAQRVFVHEAVDSAARDRARAAKESGDPLYEQYAAEHKEVNRELRDVRRKIARARMLAEQD